MNNILIIGSEGFIGSHVGRFYVSRTETTTCDIVPSNYSRSHSLLEDEKHLKKLLSSKIFDLCINCAGAASVGASLNEPAHDFELNTSLVARLLNLLRRHNPKCRFLNISSAAVYGNPKQLPISEEAPVAPISPYGYHKRMAELLCEEYHRVFGLRTCSIRIFSAYGPRLRKQLLWDTYRKMQTTPDHITLSGTGRETRDFIFISDILQQIELVRQYAVFEGGIYNVANGEQITIREIATLMKNALQYPGEISFNGAGRPGDPLYWEADIAKVNELGYNQQVSIETGIRTYVEWAKKQQI